MANESNSRPSRGKKIVVNLPELDTIILSTEPTLGKEDYGKLRAAFELLRELLTPPFRNDESAGAVLGDVPSRPAEEKPKKPGHGRAKPEKFERAKKVDVPHPSLKPGMPCPCGCGGKVYLTKRKHRIRRFAGRPPIEVTIYEMEQYRCSVCEEIFPAPLPEDAGLKTYDASAVSVVALGRYGSGLPHHRQAGLFSSLGVPIAASTQYEIVAAIAAEIKPAYDELIRLAGQGKIAFADDSWMKILKFSREENDERTGIHTTAIVSVHDDFRVGLFFTGREHAGENMARLVSLREPNLPKLIQMSDALSRNFSALSDDEVVECCCLIHGRRNFVKIADSFPEDCRHVIKAIGAIYHNDQLTRENQLDAESRLAFHQLNSGPIMSDLNRWLNQQISDKLVEPNSGLGKAIRYMLNHWQGLTQFLRVPGAPLDSNVAERAVKHVIMHRKNSLFYRTLKGALTGDIYMSLIYTCRLNGINPFDYLTELQRNAAELKLNPGDWMPWAYLATLQRQFAAAA